MAGPKALDNLKAKPKDEKAVVAGGISITFAGIIFFVWLLIIFRQIQAGPAHTSQDTGAQGNFVPASVTNTGQQSQQTYDEGADDTVNQMRDSAAQNQIRAMPTTQQVQVQEESGGTDQFGNPTNGI